MAYRPDIVFLTIDCWRHDAIGMMPKLRSMVDGDFHRREAICQSAGTPGVFPAILASNYYPTVYDRTDELDESVSTLPEVLAQAGYSTGAIVAMNPFLEKFREAFDYFWNGGSMANVYHQVHQYIRRQVRRRVQHRTVVPAPTVAKRAADWFQSADGPRFLLMHLMDLHEPFYPGLERWIRVGPIRASRALSQYQADRLSMTDAQRVTIERLYRECVTFVDAYITELLSIVPDDAILVVLGDHGEEFEHGAYRHARLYDECVRVPLFVQNLPSLQGVDRIRQLDIAPSILDHLQIKIPTDWMGEPCAGTNRDSFMLNHSPHLGESYLGLRTDRYKAIWTFNEMLDHQNGSEFYDLATDPREARNLVGTGDAPSKSEELMSRLAAFLERDDITAGLSRGTGSADDTGSRDDRLEALGYV